MILVKILLKGMFRTNILKAAEVALCFIWRKAGVKNTSSHVIISLSFCLL
jgi:hypothetical protein